MKDRGDKSKNTTKRRHNPAAPLPALLKLSSKDWNKQWFTYLKFEMLETCYTLCAMTNLVMKFFKYSFSWYRRYLHMVLYLHMRVVAVQLATITATENNRATFIVSPANQMNHRRGELLSSSSKNKHKSSIDCFAYEHLANIHSSARTHKWTNYTDIFFLLLWLNRDRIISRWNLMKTEKNTQQLQQEFVFWDNFNEIIKIKMIQ